MNNIPFISDDFIEKNTEFRVLIDRLKEAFAAESVIVPQRHHHDFPNPKEGVDSTMLLMPAWDPGNNAGVKVVTVSPHNTNYNLPSIQGLYIFFDAANGMVRAIIDAKALTNKRTAAASALGSSFLSREDSKSMLIIGTGALCRHLIAAHASVRSLEKVYVFGRNHEKAEAVAASFSDQPFSVTAIESLVPTISEVDIISCATLSAEPLVLGKYLRPGQHLDMVGAYRKDMREADDEALLKSTLFVDNFTGALQETGDMLIPLNDGVIQKADVKADLFSLCNGQAQGRKDLEEITFFKSVGHALEDLVGANYYFEQLS